jgi:antitoxin component HigA of HigAB toxin-antitoxin module
MLTIQNAGEGMTMNRSRNLGAMILRGDRNLTLAHVRKLAAHFNVSAELFI